MVATSLGGEVEVLDYPPFFGVDRHAPNVESAMKHVTHFQLATRSKVDRATARVALIKAGVPATGPFASRRYSLEDSVQNMCRKPFPACVWNLRVQHRGKSFLMGCLRLNVGTVREHFEMYRAILAKAIYAGDQEIIADHTAFLLATRKGVED
ncbi:hypothetical protein [Rhodovulum adriaticum]|nr:hypothetical protein [Rhodovulum adriaticum]MBK1636576.1 hypothetical protein [Rhodovulum adriaticum]